MLFYISDIEDEMCQSYHPTSCYSRSF